MPSSDLLSRLIETPLSPTDLVFTPDLIVVALTSRARAAPCPVCGQLSDRAHSHYRRVLADLPICGRQLALVLCLRKFRCPNAGCTRRIFCERVHDLAVAHARYTTRLTHLQRTLGLALGGEPGSRLAADLVVPTSGDTILRRVKATPAGPEPSYRFIGIDDFALRKGHTYGTILVDLQRGRVIDLFDGRDGAPVAVWLNLHPGIEVITRDRCAAYANACSAAAPKATQVADRFHLIGNIRELVERLFEHTRPHSTRPWSLRLPLPSHASQRRRVPYFQANRLSPRQRRPRPATGAAFPHSRMTRPPRPLHRCRTVSSSGRIASTKCVGCAGPARASARSPASWECPGRR